MTSVTYPAGRPSALESGWRLLRRARVIGKQLAGLEPVVRLDRAIPLEFHGGADAGWCIAAGSLSANSLVVDVGLGEDVSFSRSIIKRYGCRVHGFDPTPRAIAFVKAQAEERLVLHPLALATAQGTARLYLPADPAHVSGAMAQEAHLSAKFVEVETCTLGQILALIDASHIDLLKLDVEGTEYDVIDSEEFRAIAPRIGQLCVEFHHRWKRRGVRATSSAVVRLRELGFACCWRSPSTNEEFLFVRNP